MLGTSLASSLGTVFVLLLITLGVAVAAGALTMVILKPIVQWVLAPLEQDGDE